MNQIIFKCSIRIDMKFKLSPNLNNLTLVKRLKQETYDIFHLRRRTR